jgi:hypothetical protein
VLLHTHNHHITSHLDALLLLCYITRSATPPHPTPTILITHTTHTATHAMTPLPTLLHPYRYGHVFERSTIELWLSSNSGKCPITQKPLQKQQLVADNGVGARITWLHIPRGRVPYYGGGGGDDGDSDDLYEF